MKGKFSKSQIEIINEAIRQNGKVTVEGGIYMKQLYGGRKSKAVSKLLSLGILTIIDSGSGMDCRRTRTDRWHWTSYQLNKDTLKSYLEG